MSEDTGLVRGISWHACFPWLIIFRATMIGLYLRVILLAYAGVIVADIGPWLGTKIFAPDQGTMISRAETWQAAGVRFSDTKIPLPEVVPGTNPVTQVWSHAVKPFRHIFEFPFSIRRLAWSLWSTMWFAATWAFFGGAICRIAALEMSIGDRCGMKAAVVHACRKFVAYFFAPLFPLIGVFMLLVVLIGFGLVNWLGPTAAMVTGIFGFLAVFVALAIAFLLVPLIVGWPLMWGAISTECSDHFDALSRCYAYATQRPFHYLGYIFVAFFAGTVGLFAAALLVNTAMYMLQAGLSWGQGQEQTMAIYADDYAGPVWRFWFNCLERIPLAYAYGFLFSAAAAVYLLLRRDVDQAEMDEIVLADDQPRFAAPSLEKEADSAPGRSDGNEHSSDQIDPPPESAD